MGKFIGFVICIVIGLGILALSLIADNLKCSGDICYMQSYISKLNINISEDRFPRGDIKSVSCVQKSQPSRRGKKSYYLLVLEKNNDVEYVLGSYKNYPMCKEALTPINNFVKGKSNEVLFSSGAGFSNSMGIILSVLMFFISFVILTSKPEVVEYDWDEDENKK